MSLLPTYIQVKTFGRTEIGSRFGIYFQKGTLINFPEIKNVWAHDWIDSDGEYLYVPDNIYYKPYDLDLDFVYIGERDSFNSKIREFILYMGANEFSFFDVWQKAGLRLRFLKYKEGDKYREDRDIWHFTITFRVSHPASYGIYFPAGAADTGALDFDSMVYWSDGSNQLVMEGYSASKTLSSEGFAIIVPRYTKQITSSEIIDPTA